MFAPHKCVIEHFTAELRAIYAQSYGQTDPPYGDMAAWLAWLALENIANSDMLYHDVEHTMMVTLVGQSILQGKHLGEGGVTPRDWFHYTAATLCHDIGYVRGICRDDDEGVYATGVDRRTVSIPKAETDTALTPYHVDRSKLFVRERFGQNLIRDIDGELIASFIEMTRFPVPADPFYLDTQEYPGLVRAADFIGQLADPDYLRKVPALFYEFEQTGANKQYGYRTPGDLRQSFAKFYWQVISPYVQEGIRYLRVTQDGRQWIANLNSHVFVVEHGIL
jgi:hypothetical protein